VEASLARGDLTGALAWLDTKVAAEPTNEEARFMRLELRILREDLDGAEADLAELGRRNPDLAGTMDGMAGLLRAERQRRAFLAGTLEVSPPDAWAAWKRTFMLAPAALRDAARREAAVAGLASVRTEVPVVAGTADGRPFTALHDADELIGPFLECLSPGGYGWIAFADLRSISFHSPRVLFEQAWIPTDLVLRDGTASSVFVPALYVGSSVFGDPSSLGTITATVDVGGLKRGYGQRDLVFTFAEGEALVGVREVHTIVFE